MPELGGFLLGADFLTARLEGLPPEPWQLINFFGLGPPKAYDFLLPQRLPVTLNDSTIFHYSKCLLNYKE